MSATILVVEDCEADQQLCQRAFKGFGGCLSLVMASSAEAGLAIVAVRKPDLILLDYNLPDMDGIGFMQKLAASPDTPVPIIMLTGDDSAATAVEAMKHGAADFLVKDTGGQYLKLLPGVAGRILGTHAQRQQVQRLRQEADDKFRLLFESANDALLLLSLDGRILDINRIGHERLGYSKEEMLGRGIAEFVPPEFAGKVPERMAQILREGQAAFESAQMSKDGVSIPVEINCRVVELHGEKLLYSVARDITERKKNEAMLRQHKQVIDASIDGFWIADKRGNLLEANAAYAKMSGYSVDELAGMHISQLEANEQAADVEAHIAQVIAQGYERFETRHRRKDGCEIDVEISTAYLAETGHFYVFCRDITGRKRAQTEMLHGQYLLNAAQRLGKLGSWEQDLSSGELCWSFEMYRLFEVDPLLFTPSYESFLSAVHPEDRDKVDLVYTQSLQHHQTYDVLHRLLFTDGRIKWVREHGSHSFDASGKALRTVGMSQDITAHIVAEAALQRSEANLRAMLDNSPYMSWSKDAKGRYLAVNRMYADYLRLVDGSLAIGKTDLEMLPQALAEQRRAADEKAMATRMREHAEESSFDGKKIRWLETFNSPIIDQQGNVLGTVGFARDITERKQAEEKLMRESETEYRRAESLAQQLGYLLQGSFNEIYLFDAESLHFLLTSEGAERNLGYTDEELNLLTPPDLYPAFTRESYLEFLAPLRGGEQESLLFETVQRRKDGTDYPVEMRVQFMDVEPPVFMAVIQDITERRRAESQTREFTAHLQAVREEEKARFAREVHDELCSSLAALKMDASWLSGKLSEAAAMPALQGCADSMSVALGNLVVATRRIINEMRPSILDEIGLMGAIKWQCAQFQQRTGIECQAACADNEGHNCEKMLHKTFSINLFRIVQESLTNVARHSDATRVEVSLECRGAEVVLAVCDNGQGMPQKHAIASTSHGLRGMCERARQLGGHVKFDSPPGGGFSVMVVLPLPAGDKQ